ncbi:hypothetical protein Hanom_Chr04g00326091 [Helianthus anomalus]
MKWGPLGGDVALRALYNKSKKESVRIKKKKLKIIKKWCFVGKEGTWKVSGANLLQFSHMDILSPQFIFIDIHL